MTIQQNSLTPVPKVAAAGVAGALTVVAVWAVGLTGIEIPPEVSSALTALIGFGVGYFTPRAAGERSI